MEFNEKFSTLLTITSVKNITLAKAINIDAAQISRLKTGVREMPRNTKLISDISDYLATYFNTSDMIDLLYETTKYPRLHTDCDEGLTSDIIFTWLTTKDFDAPVNHVSQFLNNFSSYDENNSIDFTKLKETNDPLQKKYKYYYKNAGKRQAARDFRAHLNSLQEISTLRVFSDEMDDWINEDDSYAQELTESIKQFTKKGCHVQRVQPQVHNLAYSFKNIERWLPAYMAGNLKMFYYPWARDELHRCTIWVIPDQIVLYSISLYGMKEPVLTFLSKEIDIVKSFNKYFDNIISRCCPMMRVYSSNEMNKITESVIRITQLDTDGFCKSSYLSPHTLPCSILNGIHKRHEFSTPLIDFIRQTEANRSNLLSHHTLTDIMYLPDINNVINGKVPIPGTTSIIDTIYYTREEYRLHLLNIIHYLDLYPNYHVVLMTGHELHNVVIYCKGYHNTLLIKETHPFAIFDVIEPELASLFTSYLKNLARIKGRYQSREDVIKLLKKEASRPELNE